jgi:hypothetical protein
MALLKIVRRAGFALAPVAIAIVAVGCGSGSSPASAGRLDSTVASLQRAAASRSRSDDFQRLRTAVLAGAVRDFAEGTGIGGPGYENCVLGLLREALDRPALTRLVQVYRRPDGQQFAAQALNALASPLGARCGHRPYVPELIEASRGLSRGWLAGSAVKRLGITYGPYLGVRCRRPNHPGCDLVGIDVVFRHAASRVLALIGDRRVRLHTPGMHDGVRYRDWVGSLSHAGMDRPGSPFEIPDNGRAIGVWAGSPPVYVPVEFDVTYADGRHARALISRVFLSPGWG